MARREWTELQDQYIRQLDAVRQAVRDMDSEIEGGYAQRTYARRLGNQADLLAKTARALDAAERQHD